MKRMIKIRYFMLDNSNINYFNKRNITWHAKSKRVLGVNLAFSSGYKGIGILLTIEALCIQILLIISLNTRMI